jgi:ComF family protein
MNTLGWIAQSLLYPARLLFPTACRSCGAKDVADHGAPLCGTCIADVRIPPRNICATCGKPLEFDYEIESGESYSCGECLENPPPFEKARFGLVYGGSARELLHTFKFRHRTVLANTLANLAEPRLLEFFAESTGHLVIPVPLSMWGLFSRGYNQSYLLASHFAAKTGLKMTDGALVKVRHTQPQYGLNRDQRGANVKGAFAIRSRGIVKGSRILLFDDIFTTGATARECAKTLLKSGAESVRVAALFHAGPS